MKQPTIRTGARGRLLDGAASVPNAASAPRAGGEGSLRQRAPPILDDTPAPEVAPGGVESDETPSVPNSYLALQVISEKKAAKLIGVSIAHLRRLRYEGTGPPHIRLGARRIGYSLSRLSTWLSENTVGSVSTNDGGRA